MFYFLRPGQIGDMNQSVNPFFDFYKYTEVREVAYSSGMFGTYTVFLFNILPWIGLQLFDTQRHFPFVTVQGQYNCFYFISHFHEILSRTQVLRPWHFRNVDQPFNTRSNFDKCTVISHNHYFTFYSIPHFQVSTQSIPRMWSQLFQT